MQFRAKKGKDLVTFKDIYQIVLGSSVAIVSTFIILTKTASNVKSAVSLAMVIVLMIIFGVLALRPNVTPVRILIYIVMAFAISYVFSFMFSLVFEGTTVAQLTSLSYFSTVSYVATLSGALGGAIVDAGMN